MTQAFQTQDGEEIILKLRKHWIVIFTRIALTVIAGIIPFVLYTYLELAGFVPPGWRATHIFAFAGAWWLLIIWLAISALWCEYYLDIWIVTNLRVVNIDQRGLFDRSVTAWGIDRIQEASVHIENIWQTYFDYGTLEIRTAGPIDEHAKVLGIPHPHQVREAIIRAGSHVASLEETNRNQKQLLHTISHEVKSYLTKDAAALASIADGDFGEVSTSVRAIAESALEETRKGVSAVMDILKDSDATRGTMTISSATFDIKPMLTEVIDQFKSQAHIKGLEMTVLFSNDSCIVRGDEVKLRDLVFRNVIDNALRYTQNGIIRIEVWKKSNTIICTVTDTGVGITQGDMGRLFTEGGHGADSSKINAESTGFGLSAAKRILEAHGGTIIARSEGKGRGTTFIIGLPAADQISS